MKWFQHLADSHNNPKTRLVIRKQGWLGHSLMWICREFVAKYGEKYRLKREKGWKIMLMEYFSLEEVKLDELLSYHAEVNIISAKALKEGDLYIPKLSEYSDVYTKRVRTQTILGAANVPLDNTTLHNIRIHYIRSKGWDTKSLGGSDYARIALAAKRIMNREGTTAELVIEGINWISKKGWEWWTLETLDKYWADFMKHKDRGVPAASKEVDISHLK